MAEPDGVHPRLGARLVPTGPFPGADFSTYGTNKGPPSGPTGASPGKHAQEKPGYSVELDDGQEDATEAHFEDGELVT
jgi:hypothetical protein